MNRPDSESAAKVPPDTRPGALPETRATACSPAIGGAHPTVLGGFRIERLLGEGGMGAVYLAHDDKLDRAVALKVMKPEVATRPGAVARFLREARAAAKVAHDNIIPIWQVGEDAGIPFIAMPLLEGEPLDQWLKREPVAPPGVVLKVGRETADGLSAAHACGLVHRDIKPANIWIEGTPNAPDLTTRFRRVKVFDFGIARPANNDPQFTGSGVVIGTPAYMSPEQARGLPVDFRTDLFSLGVVLYLMTTGVPPFTGDEAMTILASIAVEHPEPPAAKNPNVPRPLSDLIMRMLAKERAERPSSAAEVAAELRAIGKQLLARKAAATAPLPAVQPISTTQPTAPPFALLTAPDASDVFAVDPEEAPAAPREPRRWWIWIALGLVLVLAVTVAVIKLGGSNKRAQTSTPDNPEQNGPTPTLPPPQPKQPTYTDREVAQWVLTRGGTVLIPDGKKDRQIENANNLPTESFHLLGIALNGGRLATDADVVQLSDADLVRLKGLTRLTILHIPFQTQLTDAGLAHLSGLTGLTYLNLSGATGITDAGLDHLTGLRKLIELQLVRTKVTADGVSKLTRVLPKCLINLDPKLDSRVRFKP